MTLTGIPAVIALLAICAVLCVPVWVLSLWLRDWAMRRLERRYRRKMAALGVASEVVDEDWRKIAAGEYSTSDATAREAPGVASRGNLPFP